MPYGIKDFEERIKEICDRWYVIGGPLVVITGDKVEYIMRPIEVWEKPYANGPGFMGDSKVMQIDAWENYGTFGEWLFPDPRHVHTLRKMHWNRTREKQVSIFRDASRAAIKNAESTQRIIDHEWKEMGRYNRDIFRKANRELGIKKHNIREKKENPRITNIGV